jgi:hypothetical protein
MKKNLFRKWLLLPGLSLLLALACAETGPDAGGFNNGAGGGGVASGFGQVGNGGTSSGLEAGEGGEASGFSSEAGEGGPSSGVSQGGSGALVCSDLCEFLKECALSPANSYFEDEDWTPSPEEIAMLTAICEDVCTCMVGKVPQLGELYDKALDHAVCNQKLGFGEEAESALSPLIDSLDEQLLEQAAEECEHSLSQGAQGSASPEYSEY